jgi:hypothetical protein
MISSNSMHIATKLTETAGKIGGTLSAQAWFAGGERVGYDPKGRTIVRAQSAALNVFLRREGDLAHAVSFLPGFPDGSLGWAKVLPHLPNAAEMPKLFVEYVGIGDSVNGPRQNQVDKYAGWDEHQISKSRDAGLECRRSLSLTCKAKRWPVPDCSYPQAVNQSGKDVGALAID